MAGKLKKHILTFSSSPFISDLKTKLSTHCKMGCVHRQVYKHGMIVHVIGAITQNKLFSQKI